MEGTLDRSGELGISGRAVLLVGRLKADGVAKMGQFINVFRDQSMLGLWNFNKGKPKTMDAAGKWKFLKDLLLVITKQDGVMWFGSVSYLGININGI